MPISTSMPKATSQVFERARLIGLDWGTSSLRAYLLDANAVVLDHVESKAGVQSISNGAFRDTMLGCCGVWLSANPKLPVLASGMVGSAQGWREAAYVSCPVGLDRLSAQLLVINDYGSPPVYIVPGLKQLHLDTLCADVMRGEETQILGCARAGDSQLFVLPGSHSKWVHYELDRVIGFRSFMTGELYAAIAQHTIVGRLFSAPQNQPGHVSAIVRNAFADGVSRAFAAPETLTALLFSVRAEGLLGIRAHDALPSYLSGLLIGAEIAGAKTWAKSLDRVTLVGVAALTERYQLALELCGIASDIAAPHAAARGLTRIAHEAGLMSP